MCWTSRGLDVYINKATMKLDLQILAFYLSLCSTSSHRACSLKSLLAPFRSSRLFLNRRSGEPSPICRGNRRLKPSAKRFSHQSLQNGDSPRKKLAVGPSNEEWWSSSPSACLRVLVRLQSSLYSNCFAAYSRETSLPARRSWVSPPIRIE